MKNNLAVLCSFALAGFLSGQTVTSVGNLGGTKGICPGGVAVIIGTNLGNQTAVVKVGPKQAYVVAAPSGGTTLVVELPVDAPLGPTTLTVGSSAAFNISLVQFCPALTATVTNNISSGHVSHYPSYIPVTSAYPAAPNEQLAAVATGLGPTTPVYATGTAPTADSAAANTLPSVSVAGKAVSVSTAFLIPDSPGFYFVVFNMPASVTAGNVNLNVTTGGVTSNTVVFPAANGPVIGTVTNGASYIDPALPNGGVAQGSIFVIQGHDLGPFTLATAANAFQDTALSGTSVSITISGTTVAALMYYTSDTAIGALMPSNTPAGTGTMTVTYNNQTGPAAPITVVPNSLGIFTITSDGQGAGIVTYPDYSLVSPTKAANCGGVYTTCGAANPGDVLTIWATGLGPVNGNDASGAGLGVNMTSIPLTIWLGSVPVQASYQGRSGCCVGEDQIQFTVPQNAPTGCAVPLSVQINSFLSNSVAMPIAATGSRTCTPSSPDLTVSDVIQLSTTPGPFTYGEIDLRHRDDNPGFDDLFKGQFFSFTVVPASQPFFITEADDPVLGSCQVYNNLNGSANPPFASFVPLDLGQQITVQGPNGSKTTNVSGGGFKTSLGVNGNFLVPGSYTVTTQGGPDVPKFTASITIPVLPKLTSPPPDAAGPISITRSNGLTVTWSGGQAGQVNTVEVFAATDNTYTHGADIVCKADSGTGTFTVPATAMLALPAGQFGQLNFRPFVNPVPLAGSGLSVSELIAWGDVGTPLAFK